MRGCVSGNNPRARSGRALGIPLRDHAADDQLDLVVDHHRQHDGTEAAAGEQHLGDRYAGGQALLRAAEHDGDLVFAVEAQAAGDEGDQRHGDAQQHGGNHRYGQQREQRRLAPQALGDGLAERRVHHQQDRGLIGVAQQRALPLDPAGDPRPQQVAGHERHQQLQHDAADGMQRIVDAAGGAGQCGQQQRGQEHTEDARQRSTAPRCGYVAARHRSERDGRLHGGGQGAQEQHAQVQLRGQQPAGQRLEHQPQQREQDEGAGQDGRTARRSPRW
ncbi:hypothetical protein G6F57_018082 [Rhizopus arrhizus]|nr:hypothetical protein G6F57_018082 [Rhizopus arrhizus]